MGGNYRGLAGSKRGGVSHPPEKLEILTVSHLDNGNAMSPNREPLGHPAQTFLSNFGTTTAPIYHFQPTNASNQPVIAI